MYSKRKRGREFFERVVFEVSPSSGVRGLFVFQFTNQKNPWREKTRKREEEREREREGERDENHFTT